MSEAQAAELENLEEQHDDAEVLGNDGQLTDEERQHLTPEELAFIDNDDDEQVDAGHKNNVATAEAEAAALALEQKTEVATTAAEEPAHKGDDVNYAEQLIEVSGRLAESNTASEALIKQLEELASKVDEGDLTQGQYDVEKAKIDSALRRIDAKIASDETLQAQITQHIEKGAGDAHAKYEAEFQTQAVAFLSKPENAIFNEDQKAHTALQNVINQMAQSGMSEGLTPAQVLEQARAHVALRIKLPEPAKVEEKPTKPTGERKKPDIPPNLSQMPAVIANAADGGEFVHLDKLTGVAYDAAYAKLTPSQQERYLNGG